MARKLKITENEKKCESREVEQYEDRSAEKHKGIKTEGA